MSKYKSSTLVKVKERTKQPHYLWRGIGCVMMIVLPAFSYVTGKLIIDALIKARYYIPYQLLGYPALPSLFYQSRGLMTILGPILKINNLYAYLTAGFLIMLLLGGVISLIYAIIYRMFGASQYGPLDAPPPKYKAKTYKR
ncbi:MAG: hypothetical protein IPG44_14985 [Anaerolineales bacterium]|jgi:hypothetical protein|nr:hypothetical protein [Anaerolineales bacterium]MCC6985053.1 hypothetical protein [Anaerolineales bacterium]